MKAIIFGAAGQDGFYLNQLLQNEGIQVTGVSRSGTPWVAGDITDYSFVHDLIKSEQPDYIFHLAANSTTAHSVWLENHRTICDGSLYLLESVREYVPTAKVFLSGSGLQFINTGELIKENDPFHAGSAYAVSRIHSAYAARYYRSQGIRAYVGYFFNHDSPRRSERHMSKRIVSFAKRIGAGAEETLQIGAAYVRKEWGFAGDIVRAIWTLVQQDDVFESVIGTGKAYSIEDWLDACFNVVGKDWRPYVVPVSEGFVPEYDVLVSNPETLWSLGWKPDVSFSQLAEMMILAD